MVIERKTLRSVSEFSVFKYLLVFYLIFFILALIGMGIIFLFAWLFLGVAGADFSEFIPVAGLNWIPGGGAVAIVIFIILGLIGSVFYAAIGTLSMWIINIIIKISGGIELRFREAKPKAKAETKPNVESKQDQ